MTLDAHRSALHDPSAVLDYAWDWTAWLLPDETITAYTVTAPSGVTVAEPTLSESRVTAFIGPCVAAVVAHPVTCRVTTDQGRIDDRTIHLLVRDR